MSSPNFGSKRLVVGAHYGIKDWLIQRVTAVIMAIYTVVLFAAFMLAPNISYDSWAGLFAQQWMKVLTLLALLSLFYHAWIGVRDIVMDYIKPLAVRLALYMFSLLWLLGCAFYSAQILWRV
ncbi:MAG: succinate dehydrogenase, hydrophobic membrane anchor protein [Ottowia sp.]|nr:succinate dehydrogenase, hydrophobic membrane anchor protein [Ottowia sp.]